MNLEDKLAFESKRIVYNARKIHRKKRLKRSIYLSRNTKKRELDIINASINDIIAYIDAYKWRGRFYLLDLQGINPRRLVINPLLDFFYSAFFYRGLASLGDVKIKKSIYRLLGMSIAKNVHIYQGAKFDIIFAKLIELGENTTIGGEAAIYNHVASPSKDFFGWGIVKTGKNCIIGNRSFISGIRMGDNSILRPNTVTASYHFNVREGEEYGGNPAKKRN
jgi:acetyltransferase-like isoleucine patch superfamily enzyme